MFTFEYAQNRNGRFVAWIEGGEFPTRQAALDHAKARGFKREGDDFIVSETGSDFHFDEE